MVVLIIKGVEKITNMPFFGSELTFTDYFVCQCVHPTIRLASPSLSACSSSEHLFYHKQACT